MRFEYFKLGENELKSVTSVSISKQPRKRVESTNLNGDLLIDQMAVKSTVNVAISLISAATMALIEAAVAAGVAEISYYEGAALVTKSATCSVSSRPRPYYKNGDRAQGVYYSGITLEFREI